MLKIISSDWRLSVVSLTRRWQNVQVIIILENIMMVSLTIKSHGIYDADILHICHNHDNRWLCKNIQSSVKFSNGYVKETAVILHKMRSV